MLHVFCFLLINNRNKSGEELYGKYSHNLLVQVSLQFCIPNGESINCENEKRFFSTMKSIKKFTSSYARHIIGNCIVLH